MAAPFSDLLSSYANLASSMYERWSDLATTAASRADAGGYTASGAVEDALTGATLGAEAAWLWTTWGYEAFAKLAGLESKPNKAHSQHYPAPSGAKLEVAGPLVTGRGERRDCLPADAITFSTHPVEGKEQMTFRVHADGTGHRGATYIGTVNVTTEVDSTPVTEAVIVWVTIP